jgi:hypothetical protein
VIVVPEITASQLRCARPSKMPLKSSPTYGTGRNASPSGAQMARINSMSKPLADPFSMRSNGGSG